MPKTIWRPDPFEKPRTKFSNADYMRRRVIAILQKAGKPMTIKQIAGELGYMDDDYYYKTRRYVVPVANPTHRMPKPKDRPDLGWTLKGVYGASTQ